MVLPDDSSLAPRQQRLIRKHARQALKRADAIGKLPTPVDEVMAAAKVFVAEEDLSDEGFLKKMHRHAKSAGRSLKRALDKISA